MATNQDLTLMSDGRERSYHLYRPSSLDADKPAPLLIYLHASGSTGRAASGTLGLETEAERGKFLLVYPSAAGTNRQWNAGICCGDAQAEGVDDVAFISRLIDRLSSEYHVDPSRIYVSGVSNGGMMAYRLGCELSERVAAIASFAGPLVTEKCQPARPVSVLHFNSITDERAPFQGGMRPGPPSFVQLPVPTMIERWRELNRCSAPPASEQVGTLTKISSQGCRDGSEVTLLTSDEGNHFSSLSYATDLAHWTVDFFLTHSKAH